MLPVGLLLLHHHTLLVIVDVHGGLASKSLGLIFARRLLGSSVTIELCRRLRHLVDNVLARFDH